MQKNVCVCVCVAAAAQVRATRHACLESAPNTLVLCLKRFGVGRFSKNNQRVAYGERLDLSPYMVREAHWHDDVALL
jgi:hypothetical protein